MDLQEILNTLQEHIENNTLTANTRQKLLFKAHILRLKTAAKNQKHPDLSEIRELIELLQDIN